MYDRASDSFIYFFFEIVNTMNEDLIKLNQSVVNAMLTEWNLLDDAGLWNLMFVPLGRKDKTAIGSIVP